MLFSLKKSWFVIAMFIGYALAVNASKLISPAAPFVAKEKVANNNQEGALAKPVFTGSGIVCGNKQLHWSVSRPLEVLINNKVCSLITCRAETNHTRWQVISAEKLATNNAEHSMTGQGEFLLNDHGDTGRFSRKVTLLDDGKVKMTYSWNCPENLAKDFKKIWFRIFIARNRAAGNSIKLNGKTLTFPALTHWENPLKRGLAVKKAKTFQFNYDNAPGYTFSFAENQNVTSSIRKDDVLTRFSIAKPSGEFSVIFDFDKSFAVSDNASDCVVAGINFTKCNDMDVPIFTGSANMLLNPSFESGTRYYMPSLLQFVDISENLDTEAKFGEFAYKLHAGQHSASLSSVSVPIVANTPYTFSFYAKSVNGEKEKVNLKAISYARIKSRFSFDVSGKEWKRYSQTFELPAQAVKLVLGCRAKDGVLIDGLQLEKGDKATPYAGNAMGMDLLVDSKDGMIVDATKKANPRLCIRGPKGARGKVNVDLTDFFDQQLFDKTFNYEIGANGKCIIPLPVDNLILLGVNLFKVNIKPENTPGYTDYFRISRIKYVGNDYKHSGIPATNRFTSRKISEIPESELELIKNIGVGRTRKYSFDSLSPEETKRLNDKGIELTNVEIIKTKRDYSTGKLVKSPQIGWQDYPGLFDLEKVTPEQEKEIEELAYQAAKKYPYIKNWIGPNEPMCAYKSLKNHHNEEYAKIMVAIYKGIKRGNPDATIYPIGGACNMSLAGGIRETAEILEACEKLAPDVKFDGTVIHTYRPFPESPDTDIDTVSFFNMLKKYGYGDDSPVDWNEGAYFFPLIVPDWLGIAPWSSTTGSKDRYQHMLLPSYDLGWGERVSAAMISRYWLVAYKHSNRIKCATTWVQYFIDNRNPFAWVAAQTALADLLGNSIFKEDVRFAPGARAYVFEDGDKRPIAAVWRFTELMDRGEENANDVTMNLAGVTPEFIDMMGNIRDVKHDGNTYQLPLSNYPFFIRAKPGQLDALIAGLNDASVEGLKTAPLALTAKPVSIHDVRLRVANPRSKPFTGSISIDSGPTEPISLDKLKTKDFDIPLKQAIAYNHITDVKIPIVIEKTGAKKPVNENVTLNTFAVKQIESDQIKIDADTADWKDIPAIPLTNLDLTGFVKIPGVKIKTEGGDNFSGSYRLAWNKNGLYLLIEINDNALIINHKDMEDNPGRWYSNDIVQLYFDSLGNARDKSRLNGYKGYDEDDFSYELLPMNENSAVTFRRLAPDTQLTGGVDDCLMGNQLETNVKLAFRYKDNKIVYEAMFPARYMMPTRLETGSVIGFAMTIFDRDQMDQRAFQKLTNTPIGTNPFLRPDIYPLMLLTK